MSKFISIILCALFVLFIPVGAFADTAVPTTPTGIYLNQGSVTLSIGETTGITATVSPSNANQTVVWSSSDPVVASCQSGLVIGVSAGTTTITAMTWGGSYTATCSITVNPRCIVPTGVSLSEGAISVPVHTVASLVATVQPTDAYDQKVTWSSDNPSVATASAYGVYGVATGTANVIATTDSGNFTATCAVTVTSNNARLSGLDVSGGSLNPAFAPAIMLYTLQVGNATSVDITPTSADSTATITINNNTATNGKAQTVSIANISTIIIGVISSGGSSTETYRLTISQTSPVVVPDTGLPADVQGSWAATQIRALLSKKIISGFPDGSFKPDQPITRAEFISMLMGALNLTGTSQSNFSDVSPGDWFCNAVNAAVKNNIVKGSGGNFDPNSLINREQMAVMVDGAIPIAKIKVPDAGFALYKFTDKDKINSWASKGLADCVSAGLMNGVSSSTLDPKGNATRAQAVVIIYNLLEQAGMLS